MLSKLRTDTGTVRLSQLGYRQTLQRPLHWSHNTYICFCIMSPLTAITGERRCRCQGCLVLTVGLFWQCFDTRCRNRAVWSRTPLWRPCSAHLGLGFDRDFYHVGRACNERAFFKISCFWGPVLLVIHVGWTVWALCKLACWVGQYDGAGKLFACCCIATLCLVS